MGDYSINNIYQGGYSSLTPKYGTSFGNYNINPKTLGMSTDGRTANIIQEVSNKLNTGAKHTEIATVGPGEFDAIPKQQFEEMRRLSKITGTTVSLHAPIVELSGLTQQQFSNVNREGAERQIFSAMEKAHMMSPNENISVTVHSSAAPFPGRTSAKGKEPENVLIINKDTGSVHTIPVKERTFPGEPAKRDVKQEINKLNEQQWIENLRQLEHRSQLGGDVLEKTALTNFLSESEKLKGKILTEEEKNAQFEFGRGANYLYGSYNELKELFDTAYNNASDVEKNKIKQFYEEVEKDAKKVAQNPREMKNALLVKDIVRKGVEFLDKEIAPPQLYGDLNDFAREKTAETISNVALKSLKDKNIGNGDINKTPVINVENPPAGMMFSEGQDLKDIVEKSRQKFVEKAVQGGMGERSAKEAAERLIGVTWDVGHINMLRKYGYESEDIIKETEKVAPLVKHIHLSDNFGFEHTELPMGMGNVPMKEILDKLGKQAFDAKKVIEAVSWWQHFQTPPFKETLSAFGSPIYSMQMSPYWNQSLGLQQGYYGGYGAMLPSGNYETMGAGFSRLPMELGGQHPGGEGGRMSGKGME